MNYRVKGYAANPLIIGGVCLLVGAAIGVGGTLWVMSRHQGGIGDGDTMQPFQEETSVSDVQIPAETETEPPSTEPVTENLSYIQVTVSGNNYIYKGETFTLEQLIGIVRANPDIPVHIREDGASMRAYNRLQEELDSIGANTQ